MELTTAQPARDLVPHRAEGPKAGGRPAPHRVARAAARRRVGAYTTTVTAAGFALLVLAVPGAARAAGRDPRRGAALDPAERREFVDMAVRQGTRLKELIEQLLLAARFEQTAAEPAERPLVDAAVVARDALATARVAHPGRELVLVAREALPIRAAPEAILQVLGNLLDNAAKYAPDQGPVRLEATRYGSMAVLAVEDTGPGVPGADRERIFERFTQLDSGATRRAGGVGPGLYIARQLANGQGGELVLADPVPPGRGARFELRLPLAEPSRPPVALAYAASRR
jgi:signal transduction histidine kinase